MPEPRRAGHHPSGHPESREARHPGAAEDRVSRARSLSRESAGGPSAGGGSARVRRPQLLIVAPWDVGSCELGIALIQDLR